MNYCPVLPEGGRLGEDSGWVDRNGAKYRTCENVFFCCCFFFSAYCNPSWRFWKNNKIPAGESQGGLYPSPQFRDRLLVAEPHQPCRVTPGQSFRTPTLVWLNIWIEEEKLPWQLSTSTNILQQPAHSQTHTHTHTRYNDDSVCYIQRMSMQVWWLFFTVPCACLRASPIIFGTVSSAYSPWPP